MEVPAQAVIDRLLREIARLNYELAVAQEAAATIEEPELKGVESPGLSR